MRTLFILSMLFGMAYGQCPASDTVTANIVSSISSTSVVVSGTFPTTVGIDTITGSALLYVRVGQTDTTIGSYLGVARQITGLQPNTTYRYYFRTRCTSGTTTFLNQAGYYTFTTLTAIVYTPMTAAGYQFKYVKVDSGALGLPSGDTTLGRGASIPSIKYKPGYGFVGFNGTSWALLGAGSSSTDTTRTLYSSDSTIILTYNTARDSINVQVDTNRVATKLFVTNIFNSDTTAKTDPEAIQSITAITDTSFENVHGNGDRDTVVIRGSGGATTLQQAFDNNPTASPTINARGNTIQFDSLNTMVFNFIDPASPYVDAFSSTVKYAPYTSVIIQSPNGNSSTTAGSDGGSTSGLSDQQSYMQSYNALLTHFSQVSTSNSAGDYSARISSTDSVIVNSPLTYITGGNVGIGTTTPDSTLHLVGGLKLDLPSKGNGKVLTSDANGAATWQTMTSGAAAAGTLTGTTLASNVVSSSLTGVGTITTGVWHGTTIDSSYSSGVSNINVNSPLVKLAQGKGYLITADTGIAPTKLVTGYDLYKVRDSLPITSSGTYIPTFASKVNMDSIRYENWMYVRVGNTVTVSGYIYMDATIAATNTTCTATLPIASTISNIWDLVGSGQAEDNAATRGLIFKGGTNLASLVFTVVSSGPRSYYFSFTYKIV